MSKEFIVVWLKLSRNLVIIILIFFPLTLVACADDTKESNPQISSSSDRQTAESITNKQNLNSQKDLQLTQALTSQQISKQAKEFTVRIDGQNAGSGVIIQRSETNYKVLTNWHVVEIDDRYTIQTSDGQSYPVDSKKRLGQADLALVSFSSNLQYKIAQRGDSDQLIEGQKIYIAGYPGAQTVASQRSYRFYPEDLIGFLSPNDINNGYELIYSGVPQPGMSGSPILDDRGHLIGIYGLTDIDLQTGSPTLFGIPINTAAKLAIRGGIDLSSDPISTNTSPPKNNVAINPSPISNQQPIGIWRTQGVELGQPIEIIANLKADGTYSSLIKNNFHSYQTQGYWRYEDDILYQTDSLGNSASSRVTWISNNEVELTIINNGNPLYTGVKRRYVRD